MELRTCIHIRHIIKENVGDHYMQANTNNINKTCSLLQKITVGKDDLNMVFMYSVS